MSRFDDLQGLFDQGKYFKLVCGAGNENAEEVKRLAVIYTLAGAKGFDVSATVPVVKACMEGIGIAFGMAKEFGVNLRLRPFIMVSVGMPGDHHVRKASINPKICIKCRQCVAVCPTGAIKNPPGLTRAMCIGCGNCGAICPVLAISFEHNKKELSEILPKCIAAGAENIELHAAVADDVSIMGEWAIVNKACPNNHVSMCLDRLHLSNFALESRVKKAKEAAGNRLVIQADGYPMSGGRDDYNTTLQAVATADIINKKFNMQLSRQTKKLEYKEKQEVNILLSGGTNSLTGALARQAGVKFQGVSLGTFGRNLVKEALSCPGFYSNKEIVRKAYLAAKKLVVENVGEINE